MGYDTDVFCDAPSQEDPQEPHRRGGALSRRNYQQLLWKSTVSPLVSKLWKNASNKPSIVWDVGNVWTSLRKRSKVEYEGLVWIRFECRKTVSYEEFFPGNFGVGGVKHFLGKKDVSYKEIFRKNFLTQNFLRKFWLEFSQPRKF